MKKDYIPIKNPEKNLDENAHLEDFWVSHYEGHNTEAAVDGISKDEKYLIMQQYLKTLPAGAYVLDGGCGRGEWCFFLAKQGFNVVGADIIWKILGRSQKCMFGPHFVSADIQRLSFRDSYFDVYFSWGAFEHFEEGLQKCVKESRRILKAGGLLFLAVPYQNWRHIFRDSQALEHWDENYIHGKGYVSAMRFYQWRLRPQELRRELEMRGFEILKIVSINKAHGIFRMMHHEFSWLKPTNLAYRFMNKLLFLILPSSCVAHMLMAVARKPRSGNK